MQEFARYNRNSVVFDKLNTSGDNPNTAGTRPQIHLSTIQSQQEISQESSINPAWKKLS